MYQLTKEQKISNNLERQDSVKRKINNLQNELRNLEKNLKKLQSKEDNNITSTETGPSRLVRSQLFSR